LMHSNYLPHRLPTRYQIRGFIQFPHFFVTYASPDQLLTSSQFPTPTYLTKRSQDSSVGTGSGYGVPVGSRIFFPPRYPNRIWGPPNFLSNGYRGRQGSEADHSLPIFDEVKKMWIYTPTPPYAFMA
jgi:hypothetical protein